jgi:hypothetical protein
MQEEFKTKIKRTAKKIAAVGASALVAGATMVGAVGAIDLSGLPAPIISAGAFDAYVVVGTTAATITKETLKDVAGAIELATAFGQLATTSTGAEGSATLQVEQFTGEALTALQVTATANEPLYHNDPGWSALDASSDLTGLDDVIFTATDDNPYNATVTLTADSSFVEVTRNTLAVKVNASTDSDNVVKIDLSTNRSTTAKFLEGDSVNWLGTLYEIVDIGTDGNVTLGSTSEVTATLGESFTIGGSTFNFIDVDSTSQKAQVTDAGGTTYTINTTYTTIGSLDLRVKSGSIFSGRTGASAVFETVTNSYKFAVGDLWPLNNDFVVDAMTVNTTATTVDSAITIRNNVTYMLGSKGVKTDIAEGLQFIYNDNTQDQTAALALVTYGGNGQFNITEQDGVSIDIKANDTQAAFDNITTLTLPGSKFYNWTGEYTQEITSIAENALGGGTGGYLYLRDPQTNNYELRFKPVAASQMAYAIPDTTTNLTSGSESGSWAEPVTTDWVNHTTPSGVKVSMINDSSDRYVELKVAAIRIDVDSTTYYGRKGVSWTSAQYSTYGPRATWTSSGSTGTVSIIEPTGGTLTAGVTFKSDDSAVFDELADVKFSGTTISATGNSTASDQVTDFGSNIGLLGSTSGSTSIIESGGADTLDTVAIATPQKKLEVGIGAMQNQTTILDTDEADATYPNSDVFGNTTVTLISGTGASASINKITPGIAKFDYDITTSALTKPVVLVGGSAINSLVKSLVDGGSIDFTDLIAQGADHAQVDLVENAFNSQAALAIVGYGGDDTLMAAKAVAGALLSGQPFDFADYAVNTLLLNTGTSVVNDVAVIESETNSTE